MILNLTFSPNLIDHSKSYILDNSDSDISIDNIKNKNLYSRYNKTLNFISASVKSNQKVLDLGAKNQFSLIMEKKLRVTVTNTNFDLDREPKLLKNYNCDIVTAFEILEHILNPLSVLENITAKRLFVTVPLRLWFKKAYRNPKDKWDRHFHEFEDWQFDWLLDHAGWKIVRSEKWTDSAPITGIRPLLRNFTPRYYAIEAVKDD